MAVYVLLPLRLCAGWERASVAVPGFAWRSGAASLAQGNVQGEGNHNKERQHCGNHVVCSVAGGTEANCSVS